VNRRAFLSMAALAQGIDDPARANDAEVLNFVLQLEQLQVALYAAALEEDLGPGLRSLVGEYAAHERQHVDVLTAELRKLGSEPEERPRFGFDFSDGFAPVARRVEDIVVGAYNGAIPAVLSPYVRALLVRIVHVEAQHAASFGPVAAPDSFDAVLGQAVVIQRIERYVRA
jgi:hypothetical protein